MSKMTAVPRLALLDIDNTGIAARESGTKPSVATPRGSPPRLATMVDPVASTPTSGLDTNIIHGSLDPELQCAPALCAATA